MQPNMQRRRKERKILRSNLNLNQIEMIEKMKVREILPNWCQWKEEIARKKMSGSDLRDGLSGKEFWSLGKWGRRRRLLEFSFVLEKEKRLGLISCLRRREKEMTKLPLSGSGEEMNYYKGFWPSDRNEPEDKIDQRDETFPTKPKSHR